ncbi:FCD domain-containing protein [Devosia aurantiaca]|uniref:FCD domain-containing protein n=1 Tax=Devosia aurantiaca TaxID=2714858 RepID=UPI001A98DDA7|nr:FCD domain-containing protein [Devosia aurantiaca]
MKKSDLGLDEIWEVDDILHGAVADASGNKLLAGMIRDLRRRTHVFNAYRNPITPKFTAEENLFLLEAIASGDQDRAENAMREHIESVRLAIIDRLSGARR